MHSGGSYTFDLFLFGESATMMQVILERAAAVVVAVESKTTPDTRTFLQCRAGYWLTGIQHRVPIQTNFRTARSHYCAKSTKANRFSNVIGYFTAYNPAAVRNPAQSGRKNRHQAHTPPGSASLRSSTFISTPPLPTSHVIPSDSEIPSTKIRLWVRTLPWSEKLVAHGCGKGSRGQEGGPRTLPTASWRLAAAAAAARVMIFAAA